MSRFLVIDAIQYALLFIKNHVWALMRMLLVFMAISVVLGLIVAGSSILLLQSLSNNIWLMVALESPLLAVVGFIIFGIWSVSFVTYLLALERTGTASVKEHLKKSWGLRVVKIIAFDIIKILFAGMMVLVVASIAAGAWWFGGMQLVLWHRIVLGIASAVAIVGLWYLYMRLFFTKIIIADTNADIFVALATSWTATQAWVWRIAVMAVVIVGFASCVSLTASQLSNMIGALTGGSFAGMLVGKVIEVSGALFNMVFSPLVVLYYYTYLKVAKSLEVGK